MACVTRRTYLHNPSFVHTEAKGTRGNDDVALAAHEAAQHARALRLGLRVLSPYAGSVVRLDRELLAHATESSKQPLRLVHEWHVDDGGCAMQR
jgi:hypothetical protein